MLLRSNRAGQAHIVSLALYAAIIVSGIATVIVVGTPILEDMRDATALDSARDLLTDMEDQVEAVATGGEGSQTEVSIQFERGSFVFDAARDEIRYELETGAGLVGPHRSEQVGSLRMSSMATVQVSEDTVDGTDCWRLENQYVSACIRQLPANGSDRIETDTVGYWRFNGPQDGAADDTSHYGNDGTLYGGPQQRGGIESGGLLFDGADDFVHIPADSTLDVENFTVTGWFRLAPNASGLNTIISKQSDTSLDRNYWVTVDADNASQGDGVVWARTSSGGSVDADLASSEGFNDGRWHHVAFVHDLSEEARLYVDGQLADNQTNISSPGGSGEPVGIGATVEGGPGSTRQHFNGTIDEVRVWNRSMTDDDVRFVYRQQGMLNYIDTEHLLVDYRNKEANTKLDADFGVSMETKNNVGYTNNGTGYVEPRETGDFLGRGEVAAHVDSFFGIDYTVTFTLLSKSDFVQVDVEE